MATDDLATVTPAVVTDDNARHKCCECCDEGAEPGRCVFNGRRDDHGGPCEFCDPGGFNTWLKAQPEWRTSDAPF